MSEHPRQVAIYARVSSDHQAKAATIDSQVAALKGRVEEDGHAAEDELCFLDDGYSGSTLIRPGLERLRDVAYAGAIDRVYVHSPDRLARKYAYQVLLVDELTKAGVEVVFLNHTISDSPEDELLLQMQGMIAEYERAKILERSRRGKRHAARHGSVNVLSGAPYGYRYISKQEGDGQARYEILEEQASVVWQVFQWIGRDGISIGEVRRRLHDQGVKTKTGKDWWDRATIWAMLKNPAYKGSAAFGKTRVGKRMPQLRPQRGQTEQPRKAYSTYDTLPEEQEFIPVPALVEEALFDTVAEQLVENKRRNRQGGRGAKYLLQGLLQCACCNYSYYGKQLSRSGRHGKKIDYAYYRCIGTDAYRFAGERVCDNKQVRTDLLEEAVWDDIRQLLRDPDRVRREYERRLDGGSENASARRKQLETTIHKVQRAIARLIDVYEEGLLTKKEFEPRIRASKSRLSKLQEEAATLSAEQSEQAQLHVVIDHLEAFQKQLMGGLDELDWHARREVIRLLVKRVEIDRNEVRVIYKMSPPPFASSPASGACLQDCCRRERAALRRALLRGDSCPIRHDHFRFQHPMDQLQDTPILNPLSQSVQQTLMVYSVEELREVDVDRDAVSLHKVPLGLSNSGPCASASTEAVAAVMERWFKDGLQHLEHRLLNPAVNDIRDTKPPLPASGLGDPNATYVAWLVIARSQRTTQPRQEFRSSFHDLPDALPVNPRGALVPRHIQ